MQNRIYPDDQMTPWFSLTMSPIRQGQYQLRLNNSRDIVDGRYADGRWQIGQDGFYSPLKLNLSQFEWRGLSFDPKS